MKKSKTEIALIWDAIHGILVREHNTNTKLESQIEDLNDEVINLMKSDAVKDNRIEDLERRLKKQDEIIGRLSTGMGNLATNYRDLRTLVDSHTNLHAMDNDLFKAQSNTIEALRATVASLGADSEALMSDSAHLYRREKELQAKVNDQAEALGHLSTGMESVAKSLVNLDSWMTSVEAVLSDLRK